MLNLIFFELGYYFLSKMASLITSWFTSHTISTYNVIEEEFNHML